jgi:polyisoprenoid-binding protein YceI
MIRRPARLALSAVLTAVSLPLHAVTYTLEPNYTQGVFRWNHVGFSHPAAQFAQGTGTLEFDPGNPGMASVTVTIPLKTLDSGVPDLNDEFQTAWFETAKFPVAVFKSSRVEKGGTPDLFRVAGDLTMHGITRPVTLDARLLKIGANPRNNLPTIGFEATATVKRSEFGMGQFVPLVSDEIQLQIICEAAEAKAFAQYQKELEQKDAAAAAHR